MSVEGYLSHRGFVLPAAALQNKMSKANYSTFLRKLTIVCPQKVGPPKVAKMYTEVIINGVICIHLPRTLIDFLSRAKIMATCHVLFSPRVTIPATLKTTLFDNQKIIVDHLCTDIFTPNRIAAGRATALLNLMAGQGKTWVAAGVIDETKLRTLYITHRVPLAVQAAKDLRSCFHDANDQSLIIEIFDKKSKKKSIPKPPAHITVIVINSALKQPVEFFAGYSLIIYDEVHAYCSPTRRQIFSKMTHCGLGMSATTEDRLDKFDPITHRELAFDGIIRAVNLPGFTYDDSKFDSDVTIIHYHGPPEYTQTLRHESTGNVFIPYMIDQMLSDPVRWALVISRLRELYDWRGPAGEQHNIYVFCEEREPLKRIHEELSKTFHVDTPELEVSGQFIGGIKEGEINRIKEESRIILTTYGYSREGISIAKMTAAICLTPRRSGMLQIFARILRRGGPTFRRKFIDIVDARTSMKYQLVDRMQAYSFYGATITHEKIKA